MLIFLPSYKQKQFSLDIFKYFTNLVHSLQFLYLSLSSCDYSLYFWFQAFHSCLFNPLSFLSPPSFTSQFICSYGSLFLFFKLSSMSRELKISLIFINVLKLEVQFYFYEANEIWHPERVLISILDIKPTLS